MTQPHADWRGRLPFYYGWAILAGGLLTLGITYSVMYAFSVFYVAMLEEFRWGRGEAAGVYSLFMVVSGAGALAAGALADRFGPGRVIACGALLLAGGLVLCSRVSALWEFYLAFGLLVGAGVSVAGWTPTVTMINRWFSVRLGFALGIASAGIGIGIMLVVPLVQILITHLGWRTAFVWLAGIVLAGLVPVGLLVLRGRPEDLGQRVDGGSTEAARERRVARREIEVVDRAWASREWNVAGAIRTSRLWLLAGVQLLGGVTTQMIFVHQVVYLVDSGYDRMLAASVVGLIGLLSVGAKVVWGWAADTIGREMTYTLGCLAMVVAVGVLVATPVMPSVWVLYVYALLFAIGYAVAAPLWPVVVADLFAGRNFGAIYGFIAIFNGLGNAVGAWLGGYVHDLTGGYGAAFAIAVVGKLASAALLWAVAPRRIRRVRRSPAR
ncbi:MAG: MFS transporter [Acidobacteria bacterium]|nr:MFS transporter [Acidobacteriota bacterium]